jgi:tetratricopeptide (TPR) repeat protein
MKKIILFLSILIPFVLLSQNQTIRLAVVPFDDTLTVASELEKAGSQAASLMESALKGSDVFTLRERNAIQDYIAAMEKVQLGLANPESLKQDPASLKVDYLTVGTVSKLHGKYEVDARTVSIEDMIIMHSSGASAGSLPEAIGEIRWNIEKRLNQAYIDERNKEDESRPVITVFKFKDFGPAGYGGTFAEILNSQIGVFASLSVVERKYSKSLVNEKVLEMAGVIENDNSGSSYSAKGIQYKVEGDIRVFGDMCTLNYKIISTGNDKVVHIGSMDITSAASLRLAAWRISNTVDDVLNNKAGSLNVKSVPNGVDVYIDGSFQGKTPLVLSITAGSRKIEAKLEGYSPYEETVDIKAKSVLSHTITMKAVSLKVFDTALAFERNKNWSGAVTAYGDIITAYRGTSAANQAAYRKGHIEMQYLKDYDAAMKTFTDLVNEYPDTFIRAEAYYGLLKVYEHKGNTQKAAEFRDYILKNYGETNAAASVRGVDPIE